MSISLLIHDQELYQSNVCNQTRNVKADISLLHTVHTHTGGGLEGEDRGREA